MTATARLRTRIADDRVKLTRLKTAMLAAEAATDLLRHAALSRQYDAVKKRMAMEKALLTGSRA